MYNPVSTYRIQFHSGFNFADLEKIIPYLTQLGIGTLYASPIFKAVPGSQHGYDGTDPLRINPEIGTLEDLRRISRRLKDAGIGWLQDIVPNHLAFHPENKWLMDVLEKGPLSGYVNYFDRPLNLYQGELMVPFLGKTLQEVIESGELKLDWLDEKLVFNYAGNNWPLNLSSYGLVIKLLKLPGSKALLKSLTKELNDSHTLSLLTGEAYSLLAKIAKDKTWLEKINADKTLMGQLADMQFYRLCQWQETDHTINYRRFFTVNGLIGLNMDRPEVFTEYHRLIADLVKESVFQGLRIDHIDGLTDPAGYLKQLRELVGDDTYIVVEKILEPGEKLKTKWPIQGTTGYDFLGMINNLLTDRTGERTLTGFYKNLVNQNADIPLQVRQKKTFILERQMAGEWDNLVNYFVQSELVDPSVLKTVSFNSLRSAIGSFLVECPVYRFYGNEFPLGKKETKAIKKIFKQVIAGNSSLSPAVKLLKEALLDPKGIHNAEVKENARRFYQRCMQLTGPLMAKGVEDTMMYTENHFLGHNEVGDSPEAAGMTPDTFHHFMRNRKRHWPLALNATATHDTKRGEDVRARLQGLTDHADEWIDLVRSWMNLNESYKTREQPDPNDEYLIYQTLIGAYPMPTNKTDNFKKRLSAYLEKALREAKQHSNWAEPDVAYEEATKGFANLLLEDRSGFHASFQPFLKKLEDKGIRHSLVQVMLKMTCPGIPDTYQGCEQWDWSMVDPDNRRPVNYGWREKQLHSLRKKKIADLWNSRSNGEIKLWLTNILLNERKNEFRVFTDGDYLPLEIYGKHKDAVIAFARKLESSWYIVAAELHQVDHWEDTLIILPGDAPANGQNILTGEAITIKSEIAVKELLEQLPVGILKLKRLKNNRKAGVLMPVTSLPGPYGTGDLGPGARSFADLLHAAGQKCWQLLPLNPVSAQQQYSPYSSPGSFAGNTLLISPELLIEDGLLDSLDGYPELMGDVADFKFVEEIKTTLFDRAWANYKTGKASWMAAQLAEFLDHEQYWLDDYAIFSVLKNTHGNKPWSEWPVNYRMKKKEPIARFTQKYADEILKVKWLQFIFQQQWSKLKTYCAGKGIKLFGDLPFYVSYDSADVWANRQIFMLDREGAMIDVAGVPPDYFSADGQLWGMPVFNWEYLKSTGYDWWLKRITRNLELFDLLRLDHFRAFSSFWAVPNGHETAVNGKWKKGPGTDFFKAMKKQTGELPLIAEDLGDVDEDVCLLRNAFGLPGMKVLQFAFGDGMSYSPHVPHQHVPGYVVYTGTHDNNTTNGWFTNEADKMVRDQLTAYSGLKVNKRNVAEVMIRLALSSVAQMAVIPLQDWLNLDETARINIPGAVDGNWIWRATEIQLASFPIKKVKKLTAQYGR